MKRFKEFLNENFKQSWRILLDPKYRNSDSDTLWKQAVASGYQNILNVPKFITASAKKFEDYVKPERFYLSGGASHVGKKNDGHTWFMHTAYSVTSTTDPNFYATFYVKADAENAASALNKSFETVVGVAHGEKAIYKAERIESLWNQDEPEGRKISSKSVHLPDMLDYLESVNVDLELNKYFGKGNMLGKDLGIS